MSQRLSLVASNDDHRPNLHDALAANSECCAGAVGLDGAGHQDPDMNWSWPSFTTGVLVGLALGVLLIAVPAIIIAWVRAGP